MKKKFLVLLSVLFLSSFGFIGCFEDDDETTTIAAPAAETVTLADIQGTSPNGAGITPANKANTTAAVNNLMTVSDDVTSAITSSVNPGAKAAVKSFKQSMVKSITSTKAPVTDSYADTWDEEGLITTTHFQSGSAAWESKGAYSWSVTSDDATGAFSGSSSGNGSFKVRLTNAVPLTNLNITLNGLINENFLESFNFSEVPGTSMSVSGNFGFSHRSGYSISGSAFVGYIVISCDLTASVSVSLNSTQLAAMTESESSDYIDSQFVPSGSMTVTVYSDTGAQVFQQVYTADEVWNMGE